MRTAAKNTTAAAEGEAWSAAASGWVEHCGAPRRTAEPFRRPDGSYLFGNTFRYLIAVVS
jgi:hypothetical protein